MHIFRHKTEEGHALGTVPLLLLGLSQCVVHTVSDEEVVEQRMLPVPWLLFPGTGSTATESRHVGQPGTLVVLDGTWRKCKRMLIQSPWLQSLPRMELSQLPPARNFLRKSSQPDGVSTLEAVVYALKTLEAEPARYTTLINALDEMLEQYQLHIPVSLLKAHYDR